jgi:diguanylate cyclase (GGDEF)-like protein
MSAEVVSKKIFYRKNCGMARRNLIQRLSGEIRKLGFLRGHLRLAAAWLLVCVLLGSLLWGLTLSKLDRDQAALKENAFRRASSLSKAYAEQLLRSVQQIDQITLTLKYYWKETRGTLRLEKQLREGLYPESGLLHMSLLDRNGAVATSTFSNNAPLNLAHSEFFQMHKSGRSHGLLVSTPQFSPRIGKIIIRFTRRLETADGSFDGMVSVAVDPAYFASFTDKASLSKNDFVSVYRSDGSLLAAKSGESAHPLLTGVFRSPPVFDAGQGVAAIGQDRFSDRQARIVAWQKVSNYPLISTVGLAEQEIADSYAATARDYRRMTVAGSLFLLLVALLGSVLSARLAWRKQQADEVKNAYRLATDGAREGFYMVRALYGADRSVADFVVEDCNEHGAAYYGTTRTQLIGKKFSDFPARSYVQEVVGIFRHAMETGFYEDEFQVSVHSPLQPTWIQRRLVRSGDGLAVTLRDISDMKAHEEALSRLANADAVTALPNRHWLIHYLPGAIAKAAAGRTVLALLFVDLDDFKNINDTLGHAAGDELLRAVAQRLQSVLRPQDNVVRLGGDEFTIILEQADSVDDVARVAERIMKSLREAFVLSGNSSHMVQASIGISMFPQDGADGHTLLKHADIAMYAAKASGKGHYAFYQPQLSHSLVVRLEREQALRRAIECDEFVLYYQPRVDTFSGELRGMEALLRWRHPERGLVAPLEFIPMAEETGLIVPLGELVIQKACAQLAQWQAQQLPVAPVSVNVSARQFGHGKLAALFADGIARHGLDAALIEIEITESCMMAEDQAVTDELAAIEALGIKLLVDDFGTGYSSLSQLQRLDLDVLKVDRAFTAQLSGGPEGEALFMAIVSMAHVLGLRVVAEGVETLEQLRVLQALSCNEVQGHFIAQPVTAGEMAALMQKRFLFPPDVYPLTSAYAYNS